MRTLAFDTSTKYLTMALLEDDKVKAELHEEAGIRHSEILVVEMKDLLENAGWEIESVDLVCVGLGPGSFTGLRIGAAAAKALAASGKKLIGVPTFNAITENAARSGLKGVVAPLLDARKGKVYSAFYDISDRGCERKSDFLLFTLDELLGNVKEEVVFFGDAVEKYKERLDADPVVKYIQGFDWYPRARDIGLAGIKKAGSCADDPAGLEPLYLHSKECQIKK